MTERVYHALDAAVSAALACLARHCYLGVANGSTSAAGAARPAAGAANGSAAAGAAGAGAVAGPPKGSAAGGVAAAAPLLLGAAPSVPALSAGWVLAGVRLRKSLVLRGPANSTVRSSAFQPISERSLSTEIFSTPNAARSPSNGVNCLSSSGAVASVGFSPSTKYRVFTVMLPTRVPSGRNSASITPPFI